MQTETFTDMKNLRIHALDGEIGRLADVLVDDTTWRIRYLVIDTGGFLQRHQVLVSPEIAQIVDLSDGPVVQVNAMRATVEQSPEIGTDPPVSRQSEITLGSYYGWGSYWAAPLPPGELPYPEMARPENAYLSRRIPEEWLEIMERQKESFDPHLYSLNDIRGYAIGTRDDRTFGEIEDAVIETRQWRVDDFIIHSRKWLPGGKRFICAPSFIEHISTDDRVVSIMFDKDRLTGAPAYTRETYGPELRMATVGHLLSYSEPQAAPSGQDARQPPVGTTGLSSDDLFDEFPR